MLAPLCQQKGIDPNILLAMKDKNSFGDGGFLWVIFLFFLMGWGGYGNGFGFGGRNGEGLANQINNDYGRDLLLQAINGNGNALNQLATTLNCDINAVQNAINAVNNNVREYITPFTKEQVDNLLYNYGIKLNDTTYDYVYVANMCKADFYGSSIQNEQQLCLYIKDMIEDNDAYEGMVFTRFYADCIGSGTPIYWEEFL